MFSQFLRPCSRMPNFFIFPHPMRPLSGYFSSRSTARTPILREGKDSLAHLSLRFLVGHGL